MSPWMIFLYTNNHLHGFGPRCKDFLCILEIRYSPRITPNPQPRRELAGCGILSCGESARGIYCLCLIGAVLLRSGNFGFVIVVQDGPGIRR